MEAQARAHNDEEEREADAQSDGDVPVVGEWENLDEAPADGDADSSDDLAASLQPIITIVTVRWGPRCKTWTKDALWDLYAKLGVSTQVGKTVGKRVLFDVLRDCPQTNKINDDEFTYAMEEGGEKPEHSGPRWKLLTGVEVELPPGFDDSGVEKGYYAPTNKDNAPGQPKMSYLTDAPLERPIFRSKPKDNSNRAGRPPSNAVPNERGGPSDYVDSKLPADFKNHRPIDYFHLFISKDFIKNQILQTTNRRAAAEGAGSEIYKDFVPFDLSEIYKFMALLYVNAVSPKPKIRLWFAGSEQSKIFGNDAFSSAFDKKLSGGRVIKGDRRWSHFRCFMCLYDFREDPRRLQKKKKSASWG